MPRFKPLAKLERSALADLCKNTLSRIPTVTGQLLYLAGLRDQNSGVYRHHGLAATFGRDESARALRESHRSIFQAWLNLPFADKSSDLREYLSALDEPREVVAAYWLQSGTYRTYVPPGAMEVETELFCRDLETLLELVKNEAIRRRRRSGPGPADDARDRDSSPLA